MLQALDRAARHGKPWGAVPMQSAEAGHCCSSDIEGNDDGEICSSGEAVAKFHEGLDESPGRRGGGVARAAAGQQAARHAAGARTAWGHKAQKKKGKTAASSSPSSPARTRAAKITERGWEIARQASLG